MTRRVPMEVHIVALAGPTVYEIIETSNHYAPHFARKLMRDPEVTHIAACKPGTQLDSMNFRPTKRE